MRISEEIPQVDLSLEERVEAIVNEVLQNRRIINGRIGIGHPLDEAGNPVTDNIDGSWVTVSVTALDSPINFDHNLNVPVAQVAAVNQPNVCWFVGRFIHDGNTVDAASTLSLNYEPTDAASITVDRMVLRLYAGGTRVVDGDHPVSVSIFFTPGVQ